LIEDTARSSAERRAFGKSNRLWRNLQQARIRRRTVTRRAPARCACLDADPGQFQRRQPPTAADLELIARGPPGLLSERRQGLRHRTRAINGAKIMTVGESAADGFILTTPKASRRRRRASECRILGEGDGSAHTIKGNHGVHTIKAPSAAFESRRTSRPQNASAEVREKVEDRVGLITQGHCVWRRNSDGTGGSTSGQEGSAAVFARGQAAVRAGDLNFYDKVPMSTPDGKAARFAAAGVRVVPRRRAARRVHPSKWCLMRATCNLGATWD